MNNFNIYESLNPPEINFPLNSSPIDISDWAVGITDDGVPIFKQNRLPIELYNQTLTMETPASQETTLFNLTIPTLNFESYKINPNNRGKKDQAFKFFLDKGLSLQAAAGIVGNLMHESSGLQTTIPGDGGLAYGIAQWHPDRLKGLEKLAKLLGTKKSDFYTLLEYVWKELNTKNTTENKALLKLLNAATVEEATDAFMRYYERPNLKKANFEARLKHARSCLS